MFIATPHKIVCTVVPHEHANSLWEGSLLQMSKSRSDSFQLSKNCIISIVRCRATHVTLLSVERVKIILENVFLVGDLPISINPKWKQKEHVYVCRLILR